MRQSCDVQSVGYLVYLFHTVTYASEPDIQTPGWQ